MLQTKSIKALEIFAAGRHNGDDYSEADLDAMIAAFGQVGFQPTVKAGHASGQEDEVTAREVFGAPALGYVSRIWREGKRLLADVVNIPKRFAALIEAKAYSRVSSEIYWQYKNSAGKMFPRVLKSIAFLGSDIPALTDLTAIESLFQRTLGGALRAYDANHCEFRVYELERHDYHEGLSLGDYLTMVPRMEKASANYREGNGPESCANCKYFLGHVNACSIVEGYIDRRSVSDLFEAAQVEELLELDEEDYDELEGE